LENKVSLTKTESYNLETLRFSLQRLISNLGGWNKFLNPGETVLLKPNLLSARTPDRGVTTHSALMYVLAESLLEFGAIPSIGDSPGGAYRGVERVLNNTGMKEVADKLGLETINFEASSARIVRKNGITLYITKALENFDRVISISKLKTHSLMLYTGAIKNLFGCIPGFRKSEYHKMYPLPTQFGEMLVALFGEIDVDLHIMDAVVGMEGNGPASGDLRDVGLLLASKDGVALDRVAEHIVGIKAGQSVTTKMAANQGLGCGNLDRIEITGENLRDCILDEPFKLPPKLPERLIPAWMIRMFAPLIWVRPAPMEEKCTRCGVCAQNCPVNAITMHGKELPDYNYKKCITCLCCHELCPEDAIELEMSWLAKKVR